MAVEAAKVTVKMKYVGHFKGAEKIVELPIPLVSKSQKLDETLTFKREGPGNGPAYCHVPLEWAGALMDVGGNWQLVDKLTPDLLTAIKSAQETCNARMQKFALENELVAS